MGSAHDTEMAAAFVDIADTFGEDITYTPSGAAAVSCKAIVNRGPRDMHTGGGVLKLAEGEITIEVQKADVATVTTGADTAAVKRRNDAVCVAQTFTVRELIEQDGGRWHVRLV